MADAKKSNGKQDIQQTGRFKPNTAATTVHTGRLSLCIKDILHCIKIESS
jgi:hypothetical protein